MNHVIFFDHMKKATILFSVLFNAMLLIGQVKDSYELENFSIMSPIQSQITEAKGWSMQDNGKWAYGDNVIPYTDSRTNTSRQDDVESVGIDNFTSIELRKIMIDDKQYNVLVKKYKDGEYEFPLILQGWTNYLSLVFYVFKGEKLAELLPEKPQFNVMYLVDLDCFVSSGIENFEKNIFIDAELNLKSSATGVVRGFDHYKGGYEEAIIRQIQDVRAAKQKSDGNLIVAIYPIKSNDKEVVRFKFVKSYKNDNLVKMQTSPDNWKNIFESSFYEVDYVTWSSFIQDSKNYFIEVDKSPTEYSSNYNWGILRYQIGDYVGALEAFNKAIEENPETDDFMIYSYRGNTKSKSGMYYDAIADFTKAIELKPTKVMDYSNWVKNYFNRGVARFYTEDTEGACEDWKKSYDLGYGSASEYLNNYCGQKTK
jgi:tetratricopeptide (TPR) repeat protein